MANSSSNHENSANCRLPSVNVGETERLFSMFGAGMFATFGLLRGSLPLLAIGGGLAYRGLTGHCHGYEALGYDTANATDDSRAQREATPKVILSE